MCVSFCYAWKGPTERHRRKVTILLLFEFARTRRVNQSTLRIKAVSRLLDCGLHAALSRVCLLGQLVQQVKKGGRLAEEKAHVGQELNDGLCNPICRGRTND